MRYITTTNGYIQFNEADGSDNLIASKGFPINQLYYSILNNKVVFYLVDSETPYRNDVWSIGFPVNIDGEDYDSATIGEAMATLFSSGGGGGDLSNYYNKTETDGLLADKLDVSAYTPTDLSQYWTSAQTEAAISTATSGKADESEVTELMVPVEEHMENSSIHVSVSEKNAWNDKLDATDLKTINGFNLVGEGDIVIEGGQTIDIDPSLDPASENPVANSAITNAVSSISSELTEHAEDTDIHTTAQEKAAWNGKQNQLTAGSGISISNDVISVTGGSSVTVDPALDSGSTNPVANSAITQAIIDNELVVSTAFNQLNNSKQNTLTAGSGISINNDVISVTGGGGGGQITVDSSLSTASTNPVQNKVITGALSGKADTSTTYTKGEVDALIAGGQSNLPIWKGSASSSIIANWSDNTASAGSTFAQGITTSATTSGSHSEGGSTLASGNCSHAEGGNTVAGGQNSHAEGQSSKAFGRSSHAEGYVTEAYGDWSHAEGLSTVTSGNSSHAEGHNTTANGEYSHAEGEGTTANGINSHAEGEGTTANGDDSHAEGFHTSANGTASHSSGYYTTTPNIGEFACGWYNAPQTGASTSTIFTVGTGRANEPKNGLAVLLDDSIVIRMNNSDTVLQTLLADMLTRLAALENA